MVSTLDFESSDPSTNLDGTYENLLCVVALFFPSPIKNAINSGIVCNLYF